MPSSYPETLYDHIAPDWGRLMASIGYPVAYRDFVQANTPRLNTGSRVCDIGTGCGTFAQAVLEGQAQPAVLALLDPSKNVLEQARAALAGRAGVVSCHHATLERFRPGQRFDLVSGAETVRAMPGCVAFRPFADPENPGACGQMHEWEGEAAFQAYTASPGFAQVGKILRPVMTAPPISRRFDAEATRSFQVDRHYLLYAARGAMRLEAGGRRWSLPPARAALIEAGKPIQISVPQQMTVCSMLFDTGFVAVPPTRLSVFEMTPLARELDLTEQQIDADPNFSDIAQALAITPRSLSRRFADELGMTWRQALRQMRMTRAIEALAGSDLPIASVALDVGYGSLSAFNAAFREFTGQTPTSYRASFRT